MMIMIMMANDDHLMVMITMTMVVTVTSNEQTGRRFRGEKTLGPGDRPGYKTPR